MPEDKKLGKIAAYNVGIGGYQDAMLGIHISFEGKGWGVGTTQSTWSPSIIEVSKHTKWTEADRSKRFDEIMRSIDKTLSEAKVKRTQDLIGIPVEIIFEDNALKSWRILTEVL